MKPSHLLLASFLLLATTLHARTPSLIDETNVYETLFETINQKRFGLTEASIKSTKDPFIKIYPDAVSGEGVVPKKETYRLYAIFNNRVKINTLWLERGDVIGAYRLSAIGAKDVTLVSANHTLKLTLSDKGNNNVVVSFK